MRVLTRAIRGAGTLGDTQAALKADHQNNISAGGILNPRGASQMQRDEKVITHASGQKLLKSIRQW